VRGAWCPRNNQHDTTGTNVLASRYDATIEKPTASESGMNIAFAAPSMKKDETNTANTHNIAISNGSATSFPESATERAIGLPRAGCVWMFSIATVAMSTRMPMARANPPSVMMFTVWPVSHSATTPPINASGMFSTTTSALRQSRRNNSTTIPVSNAPNAPSSVRPAMARVT
jgi:hypothetical protein